MLKCVVYEFEKVKITEEEYNYLLSLIVIPWSFRARWMKLRLAVSILDTALRKLLFRTSICLLFESVWVGLNQIIHSLHHLQLETDPYFFGFLNRWANDLDM